MIRSKITVAEWSKITITEWLVRGALAVAMAWGALAGGLWVYTALFGGFAVPNYEPIQYRGRDSSTAAQKTKFKDIYNFAIADMERRHVSARKFNQFLWQMHFFIPVKYKPFDCAELNGDAPLSERANDYIAMGQAMRDTRNAFPAVLPMVNIGIGPNDGGEISRYALSREDLLQAYSANLLLLMMSYGEYADDLENPKNFRYRKSDIRAADREFIMDYFDPLSAHCSLSGIQFLNDGLSINQKYIDRFFSGDEPVGIPVEQTEQGK